MSLFEIGGSPATAVGWPRPVPGTPLDGPKPGRKSWTTCREKNSSTSASGLIRGDLFVFGVYLAIWLTFSRRTEENLKKGVKKGVKNPKKSGKTGKKGRFSPPRLAAVRVTNPRGKHIPVGVPQWVAGMCNVIKIGAARAA